MTVHRRRLRKARLQDVEVRVIGAANAVGLSLTIVSRVTGRIEQDRVCRNRFVHVQACPTILFHVHPMRRKRFIGII